MNWTKVKNAVKQLEKEKGEKEASKELKQFFRDKNIQIL